MAELREPDGPRETAGTVATYGLDGGTVVLDDGTRLGYPASAVHGVRLLHPGQRVRLRLLGDPPEVDALTLAGLPLR